MDVNIFRASFNPILKNGQQCQNHELLEQQCRRLLSCNEKVEIGEFQQHFLNFPYMLRLILSLYYTLAQKLHYTGLPFENIYLRYPLTTPLKTSLLKLLAAIIEKRLFITNDSHKLYEEVTYSLLLKPSLFSFVLSILSENTNFVVLQKLIAFYNNLSSEKYAPFLPIYVYHLYGGGPFTIELRSFKDKLSTMIESIGKVLSTSETIINRNIEQFKNDKERTLHLEESVKTVMMSKNKEALLEIVNFIANPIFVSRDYLQKQEFLFQIHAKPIEPTLTIFLLLARSEAHLFEEKAFRSSLLMRSQITKTNFYTNEMTKLFNKCPFNGDDRCNCKKCQCVRRNRQSAKLSQQKKRNAVEQLQNFKRRIFELEERDKLQGKRVAELELRSKVHAKKNLELQQQNLMLKSLLKEMKANPNIKLLMMQTIQPVSKVLNNEV